MTLSRSVAAANQVLSDLIPLAAARTATQPPAGSQEDATEPERSIEPLERQVAQLRESLGQSEALIADLRSQVAAQEASLGELGRANENVETLRGRIGGLEQEIVELEAEIASTERRYERVSQDAATRVAALNRTISGLRATIELMRTSSEEAARAVEVAAGDLRRQLPGVDSESEGPEVVDLLNTRVLLRAIVSSPSVREQYPSLYEEMETYFRALARERTKVGREVAFGEASRIVQDLADRLTIDLPTRTRPDSLEGYLERVVALVQGSIASFGW